MVRSKIVLWVIVAILASLIVWRVGFYTPKAKLIYGSSEQEVANEPNRASEHENQDDANDIVVASDANEIKKTNDENQPNELTEQKESDEPNKPFEPNEPVKSSDSLVAINLKDVEMKNIVQKIADWTGKVVIPDDEAMKQKVTIYAPKKFPRDKALEKIYSALRMKGYIAEHTDDTIYLKPIAEAKLGMVPTIPAEQPLAQIENKNQIVQKFFKLVNYSAAQMGQVIQPLVGEYGHVSADESTSSVLVIDTVENLMRIERIILELDVSQAEQLETEVFEIHHGDPEEIVQLLEKLLGSESGSTSGTSRDDRPFRDRQRTRPTPAAGSSKTSGTGGATSVTVRTGQTPIVLIPQPKYNWIIVKATAEDIKRIDEWIKKLDRSVPTMLVDQPLETIENKNQIVQKFFKLKNYSPSQMSQIVGPLLSETGHVSADESTGNLLVTDSVENLLRIKAIIAQFDIPEAEQTVTNYFEIKNGDPSEIVQVLRLLISGETGTSTRSLGRSSSSRGGFPSSRGSMMRVSSRSGTLTSVTIGPSQQPVVLIPVPRLKWIIARASAEDMKRIEQWIQKLDTEDPVKSEHETVPLRFVDPSEVADRLNEALQQVTGTELQANVLVQPLVQAKQIMIFGRADMREMVKKLIQEIDIPSGMKTKVFKLKHADADQIKENIDNLYGEQIPGATGYSSSALYYYYRYGRRQTATDIVRVISFPTMQQVTVIASPENLVKIGEQIKEWDIPLDVKKVKPRIIELQNSDPVQMADLLTSLFSEESGRGISIYDILFGRSEEKKKIVGPLYGQLTFEDVPGTKKIIVISKIPEAYDVVENLVRELDRQEMAEVPKVVTLKYADPEELSERLNALFNEPGTTATIRYSERGLSDYSMDEQQQSTGNQTSDREQGGTSSEYRPWWTTGRRTIDEEPISNVIGRVRFIPDPHSKSILVLAPPEFMDSIEKTIKELDIPGRQVMIKAIIIEVEHSDLTSLGMQLSSDPVNAFGNLDENAVTALTQLQLLETSGSLTLSVGTDITALVDLLVKKVNAKILNQQTLWTKDNEEAMFFKGDKVAFQTVLSMSEIGGRASSQFDYERVGMTLRARPSITPEKKVDMIVNVILSQLTGNYENSQPVRTEMETTTNMIVQDGQTIMLGGILFQKDSTIKRKVPLFGDVPVAGGLFRHKEIVASNNEMVIFITPYVIDEPDKMLPETIDEIERPKEKLKEVQEQLKATLERLQNTK